MTSLLNQGTGGQAGVYYILHKKCQIGGDFFVFERVWTVTPSKKSLKPPQDQQVGIFPEEQNPIGSVVTEILRDGRTDIKLLCIVDIFLFQDGECSKGPACSFAHSEAELRKLDQTAIIKMKKVNNVIRHPIAGNISTDFPAWLLTI